MKTMDDETFVLKNYRLIPSIEFKFIGRFFHYLRIKMLTKSILFSKSWIDSSAKSELPPDFHNDKHHIMMEAMRIDDCVNEINGKRAVNSFERTKRGIKKYLGMNKKDLPDVSLYYLPDTRNSKEYNFKGYFKNFERVVNKHSEKVDSYRNNYPKCKKTIFLICDESNNYIQVFNKADLKKGR